MYFVANTWPPIDDEIETWNLEMERLRILCCVQSGTDDISIFVILENNLGRITMKGREITV